MRKERSDARSPAAAPVSMTSHDTYKEKGRPKAASDLTDT
jgi:hypothetical protein